MVMVLWKESERHDKNQWLNPVLDLGLCMSKRYITSSNSVGVDYLSLDWKTIQKKKKKSSLLSSALLTQWHNLHAKDARDHPGRVKELQKPALLLITHQLKCISSSRSANRLLWLCAVLLANPKDSELDELKAILPQTQGFRFYIWHVMAHLKHTSYSKRSNQNNRGRSVPKLPFSAYLNIEWTNEFSPGGFLAFFFFAERRIGGRLFFLDMQSSTLCAGLCAVRICHSILVQEILKEMNKSRHRSRLTDQHFIFVVCFLPDWLQLIFRRLRFELLQT